MRSFINHSLKYMLLMLFLSAAATVNAQNARLNLDNLKKLEDKAIDIVEVNIDGKLLALAKRVLLKVKDPDANKIGEAIKGLEAVYVRVYNFEKENEYNVADIDEIRSQLKAPGWEKLARVRSKKKDQKIDVYTMFTGDDISGVAVVLSEVKRVAIVNVIGPIDIDTLVELSRHLKNIPEIHIEKDKKDDGN